MRLLELLTRTRFQVFTFPLGTMKSSVFPNGAGSGFMLKYKGKIFFITADHVCHPFDHEIGRKGRAFVDKDTGIVNNWVEKDGKGNTFPILTPIGGFYYFDQFVFSPENGFEYYRPFDATFAVLESDRFHNPFKNEALNVANGPDVQGGMDMIIIPSETIIEPSIEDRYIVYGHTNFARDASGTHLIWRVSCHENMRYTCENGDYYVLQPEIPIINEDWMGISGAPVFNQDGGLIGVLCGGEAAQNAIFVMKIQRILSLIDMTLEIGIINEQV